MQPQYQVPAIYQQGYAAPQQPQQLQPQAPQQPQYAPLQAQQYVPQQQQAPQYTQYVPQTPPQLQQPQYGQQQQQPQYYGQPQQGYLPATPGVHGVLSPNAVANGHPSNVAPSDWTTTLMSCCDDGFVCCVGFYLPAVLYGENYRKVYGDGCCTACLLYYCCGCFACCFASHTRTAIRNKYGLPDAPCSDCCVHCWCSQCAICQESREMRAREKWKTWH